MSWGRADPELAGEQAPRRTTPGVAEERRAIGHRVMRRVSPDGRGILIIFAVVVAANLLYLLGIFEPNPLGPVGRLLNSERPGLLGGVPVLDKDIGYTSQALGYLAANDWLHLHVPWWNPYEGTGVPLAGEMQSAAFFPPTLLLAIGGIGQLLEHMLLEVIGGSATFLLLGRIGVRRPAAAVGGAAFALNGTFAWFGHAAVNPVAFLPLSILGLELAYDAALSGRRGCWRLLAIALALSIVAGFPEVTYLDGLLLFAWFIWRLVTAPAPARPRFATKCGGGAAVGLLLCAPLLNAFLRFLPDAFIGVHNGAESTAHLPLQAMPQLLLPYIYGNPSQYVTSSGLLDRIWAGTSGYLTIPLVLLAFVGLRAHRPRGLRWLLAAWIAVALCRNYGFPVVAPVLNLLPGMTGTLVSRYDWATIEFAAIILASLGLDSLIAGPLTRRQAAAIGALAAAAIAASAAGAFSLIPQIENGFPRRSLAVAVAWAVIGAAAVVLATTRGRSRTRVVIAGSVLIADLFLMFVLPELSAQRDVQLDTAPVSFLRANLGLGRFATVGPFRPDYGAYFRVASINELDAPLPKDWTIYLARHLDPRADPDEFVGTGYRSPSAPTPARELIAHVYGYAAAGVKYVLTFDSQPLPADSGLTRVGATPSTLIYRVPGAARYFSAAEPGCTLTPHGRESVTASCPHATLVVRRETYLRGWTARIDGHSAPIRKVGLLFQGVTVPAGTHTVTFSYGPPGQGLAWVALGFGALCLLVPIPRPRSQKLP